MTTYKEIRKGDTILPTQKGHGKALLVKIVSEIDGLIRVSAEDRERNTYIWTQAPDQGAIVVARERYEEREPMGILRDTLYRTLVGEWILCHTPREGKGWQYFMPMQDAWAKVWLEANGHRPTGKPESPRPRLLLVIEDGAVRGISKTPGLPDFDVAVVEYDEDLNPHDDSRVQKDLNGDFAFYAFWDLSSLRTMAPNMAAHLQAVEERIELGLPADLNGAEVLGSEAGELAESRRGEVGL